MGRKGGLRPLGGIELLDCPGLHGPTFIGEGESSGRGVKGGPMLCYPAFQVNSAPRVGAVYIFLLTSSAQVLKF